MEISNFLTKALAVEVISQTLESLALSRQDPSSNSLPEMVSSAKDGRKVIGISFLLVTSMHQKVTVATLIQVGQEQLQSPKLTSLQ
jgi:hypothetical protein